ncbi:saccharopine dehydrogenase family protein [Thermococcus sp.]
MKVLVLGAGNIGKAIAYDLARGGFDVHVGDKNVENLKEIEKFATPLSVDASDFDGLVRVMKEFELVVGALPGKFGFKSLEAAIEAGVDMVDISFMPEDPFVLRERAEEAQVTIIVDAGFAPGLSNILMGRVWQEMDELKEGYIYVGGLPKEPKPPLYYRITWSPYDLIEEYTRPARVIRDGGVTAVDPFEEIKRVTVGEFEFEAFISDGLRSLLENIKAEKLEEWTLRWPGHLKKMKVLRELGFFKPENIDKTLEVITPLMSYESPDFSIMQVVGKGIINGEEKEIGYLLYDEEKNGFTSMARITGFTAAVIARIVAEQGCVYGVIPPEILGMRIDTYTRIMNELEEKGIEVQRWG